MSITLNTKAYSQDAQISADAVQYVGPANTFAVKDRILLTRTAPKPTKDFAGMARCRGKVFRTVTLADASTAEAVVDVYVSTPVGMADADVNSLIDDAGDLILSAAFLDVVKKHDLTA